MKTISKYILYTLALILASTLWSCGGSDDDSRDLIFETQEIQIDAAESSMILTVDKLISAIKEVQNSADWLTFELQSYSSGAPQVKVSWKENNEPNSRKATVFIKTNEGDQITLTVIQKVKTEMDDKHETPTDGPAYSPKR